MDQVIYWINRMGSSIHILIYSFTLEPIADAFINASQRGWMLRLYLRRINLGTTACIGNLQKHGFPSPTIPILSLCMMIVDGIIVLTGSYNWSK